MNLKFVKGSIIGTASVLFFSQVGTSAFAEKAEKVKKPPARSECSVRKPTKGLLNSKHPSYTDYKIEPTEHGVIESAILSFKKLKVPMELKHGGCDHFTYTFSYTVSDKKPISNSVYYFAQTIELIEATQFIPKQVWVEKFLKKMKSAKGKKQTIDSGSVPVTEGYSHVFFKFENAKGNKKRLRVAYDIAL